MGYTWCEVTYETFEGIFGGYDKDNSGKLSRFELKKLVDELGSFGEGFVGTIREKAAAEEKK